MRVRFDSALQIFFRRRFICKRTFLPGNLFIIVFVGAVGVDMPSDLPFCRLAAPAISLPQPAAHFIYRIADTVVPIAVFCLYPFVIGMFSLWYLYIFDCPVKLLRQCRLLFPIPRRLPDVFICRLFCHYTACVQVQ